MEYSGLIFFDQISMTQENLSNLIKIKFFDSFEGRVEISTFEEISTFSIFSSKPFLSRVFPIVKTGFEEISSISIFEEISTFSTFSSKVEISSKLAKDFNLGKNGKFPQLWQISCNHCTPM